MLLNDGSTFIPDDKDVIAWQRTYKAVDVNQELAAMESWLDANPTRRKTKRGVKKFINSWLSRAQDRGGSPMVRSKTNSIRNRNIEDSLADVSWLQNVETKNLCINHFLVKYGFYWDGERKNERT
jgi:hypothetical protein